MIDRLEKLMEFADWACKDHHANMRKCLCVIKRIRDKGVYVIGDQFFFELEQWRRWDKYRKWLKRCQRESRGERFLKLMSVSEYCRKFHLQCCSWCEDIDCCDNTSRAKERITELEKISRHARELANVVLYGYRYRDWNLPQIVLDTCHEIKRFFVESEEKS